MANLYEKASLVLPTSPAYKDGAIQAYKPLTSQGTFDFSRGSNLAATRVDANGLIEKGRENLLPYSNTFSNSNWTKARLNLTSGQEGYDGSNNAWNAVPTSDNNTHALFYNISGSLVSNGVHSFSFYAKRNGYNYIVLRDSATTETKAKFDLFTGATETDGSSAINSKITSVGNEWYRCEFSTNRTSGGGNNFLLYIQENYSFDSPYVGNTTSGVLIQDAQIEQSLVATDYIETGADTAQAGILEDLPRLDYSGDASCPSLLLEPSRTNLVPSSEYFSASEYTLDNVTVTANATISPEGIANATEITRTSASGNARLILSNKAVSSGAKVTISIFAKANTASDIILYNTASTQGKRFDLSTGTAGDDFVNAPDDFNIEDYGNGWYRCWVVVTAPSTTMNSWIYIVDSATTSVYFYGQQMEEASYPTSYIPTYGSAVTRSQDVPTNLSASDLIGSDEGVMFLDLQTPSAIEVDMNFSISDGTGSNYARIEIRQDLSIDIRYRIGGSNQISARVGSFVAGDRLKLAFAYKSGDSALYMNGSQLTTTSGTISSNSFDEIRYSFPTGIVGIEGNVKETFLFKTRLLNAELAALTTI